MKKIVVTYKTKYGSTKKYAEWIAEKSDADIFQSDHVKIRELEKYETIVHCGGLYIGGILGLSLIKKNINRLENKNIIIIAVGATTKIEEAREEVIENNLKGDLKTKADFFLLRGALNYPKMNILDRFLMFLLVKKVKMSKKPLNRDSEGMLATYGKTVDFTNEKYLEPVIKKIKEYNPM